MNSPKNILIIFLLVLTLILIVGTCLFFAYLVYKGVHSPTSSSPQRPTIINPSNSSPISSTAIQTPIMVQETSTESVITPTISPTSVRIDEPTATLAAVIQDAWCIPWNSKSTHALVIEVLDGVTIKIISDDIIQTVKYIGIEKPEDDFASNAREKSKNKNQSLVLGKEVLLIEDNKDRDDEEHLLRYVIVDSIFVNQAMLESGYAIAENQPPNISCDTLFALSEINAINLQLGLWGPESTATRDIPTKTPQPLSSGNIRITFISPEGKGWKQPDEFVEIMNQENHSIQLENWILKDSDNHVYHFPPYTMTPGQYCRIYTNTYDPTTCGFTLKRLSGIWSDDGECAYLYNSDGLLISTFCIE